MNLEKVAIVWLRRDLRLNDHAALSAACQSGFSVMPLFIFDPNILGELASDDARVALIYARLRELHGIVRGMGGIFLVRYGNPPEVLEELCVCYPVAALYYNRDYEPYARERDALVEKRLIARGVAVLSYADQVVFEPCEILKADGRPYTVFTAYKKQWMMRFDPARLKEKTVNLEPVLWRESRGDEAFPEPSVLGFRFGAAVWPAYSLSGVREYANRRDYPALAATSGLSPHLRFGTVSVRAVLRRLPPGGDAFLSELIWREFFMQILYHYPHSARWNFHPRYNGVLWRDAPEDFDRWRSGETGFPLVDAGMRELNATGLMHNRVRMVVASFLSKHLLIDWRLGERYFASKLLDYDLSANVGNWQWAAGTGCDAVPYFRIFNPQTQLERYDPEGAYVRRWVPEWGTSRYPEPMVDHREARERCLRAFRAGVACG